MEREQFGSRIGFLFMTAGCAIGLGNVWRFPYIAGLYGGAIFVLIYLFFLFTIGFPVMVAELALGRGAQSDLPGAFKTLKNDQKGPNHWVKAGHVAFIGNVMLLMFYSVVTGWMLAYLWKYCTGGFELVSDFGACFGQHLANWPSQIVFTEVAILITTVICMIGVRKGIERSMKVMLGGLFLLQIILIVMVMQFDGAGSGVRFFLAPDLSKLNGATLWPAIHAAMMHAFFTLSLGIGSVAICGSYIGKERSLSGESLLIIALDTTAAIASGLIIFPACFAFNVQPGQGPSLIFVTLTKVFSAMPGGTWLGLLFFVFMSVAALSTLVAVGENIIAYTMRMLNWSRIKASVLFGVLLSVLSLPCLFGFNLWQNFHPMGKESCVLDLEDFIVSDNLLPLGAVVILLFCCWPKGWGLEHFLAEANTGKGMRFPRYLAIYMKWVLPVIILALWAHNIIMKFFF